MYVVYGFDECQFCQRAKEVLDENDVEYEYHEVPPSQRRYFLEARGFSGDQMTYPKVWEGDRLVGGFSDLEAEVVL